MEHINNQISVSNRDAEDKNRVSQKHVGGVKRTFNMLAPVLLAPENGDAWFSASDFSSISSGFAPSPLPDKKQLEKINADNNFLIDSTQLRKGSLSRTIKFPKTWSLVLKSCASEYRLILERSFVGFFAVMGTQVTHKLSSAHVFISLYEQCQKYSHNVTQLLGIKASDVSEKSSVKASKESGISALAVNKEEIDNASGNSLPVNEVDKMDIGEIDHVVDAQVLDAEQSKNAGYNQSLVQQLVTMNAELQKQVKSMKHNEFVLKKQVKKDEECLRSIKQERDELEAINQEIEVSLSAISVENARLSEKNSELKVIVTGVEQSFEDSQQREIIQKGKYNTLEKKFLRLSSQASQGLIEKEKLIENVSNLEQGAASQNERIKTLASITKRLLSSIDETALEIDAPEGSLEYIHLSQKKIIRRTEVLEESLLKTLEEKTLACHQVVSYRQQLEELHQEKSDGDMVYQKIVHTLEQQLEESTKNFSQKDRDLQQQLKHLESSRAALEKQYMTLKRVFKDHIKGDK